MRSIQDVIRDLLRDRKKWGSVLTSPLSYKMVGAALALARRSFQWQATYQMARFALAQTRRAFAGKDPVVWTSAFFPTEIVWALGLCPFSPEVAAAFITSLGFGEDVLAESERAGYSRDLCSFHRCTAGAAHLGLLPRPAALAASTHLCDGAPLLFQNMARFYRAPFFLLDVPYSGGEEAEAYVAAQLEALWKSLAEATGRRPDLAALRQAVARSESYRAHLTAVNSLRRAVPAPVRGSEMLGYLYLFFAGQGSREAAQVFATLARELEARRGLPAPGVKERARLLWLHLRPYYSGELLDYLELQEGAVLAFEEMSHVYWPPLAPEDPFRSLARKVLAHFAYKPLEHRVATVAELARGYRVDGIVHFSHWGCRQSSGGALILREELQRLGWPVLVLDGDCLDRRNEAPESLLTRAQAFLELLHGG